MSPRTLAIILAAAALGISASLCRLWQPDRQVLLHQAHLLAAIQDRSGGRFGTFIDDSYSDRWGHDRAALVRNTTIALQQFSSLSVRASPVHLERTGGSATITTSIQLDGRGAPVGDLIKEKVNMLDSPFVFKWARRGWAPWSWKLISCDNPRLAIPPDLDFQ